MLALNVIFQEESWIHNLGAPSLPNETEMRKLIEQSLISNGDVDQKSQDRKCEDVIEAPKKEMVQENIHTQKSRKKTAWILIYFTNLFKINT